ncbi:hypothetical protein RchiOBHm_Chr4g0391271 [Rosa chinensis]|uniref:Uncharacterized protein n=1 Tax=Rosa chinensis TaxID=74649 RepID=A0A2P6QQE7_ROSCH|nr:hypothetical protein RchiOBHm_Chr4g0391271 [Rosa chinensis]
MPHTLSLRHGVSSVPADDCHRRSQKILRNRLKFRLRSVVVHCRTGKLRSEVDRH